MLLRRWSGAIVLLRRLVDSRQPNTRSTKARFETKMAKYENATIGRADWTTCVGCCLQQAGRWAGAALGSVRSEAARVIGGAGTLGGAPSTQPARLNQGVVLSSFPQPCVPASQLAGNSPHLQATTCNDDCRLAYGRTGACIRASDRSCHSCRRAAYSTRAPVQCPVRYSDVNNGTVLVLVCCTTTTTCLYNFTRVRVHYGT